MHRHRRELVPELRVFSVRNNVLKETEGNLIVDTLIKFAFKSVPLNQDHITGATATFVEALSTDRRSRLPFKKNGPGYRFVNDVVKWHQNVVRFALPVAQE